MKIRRPWLINLIALVGAWVIRLWLGTLRYEFRSLGPEVRPKNPDTRQHFIYAFWHENLLLPACYHASRDTFVLVSQHADGQLIAETCRRLGFSLIRGSTTRGGTEAVRQMLRKAGEAHLAITPDGPRGPRRRVQPGVIYLAARTGMLIAPAGIAYDRPWRMRSWDQFAVPRPWSMAVCVIAQPIAVPPDADKETLEQYRQQVEARIMWATDMAERWVATGRWPSDNEIDSSTGQAA
jgi:hypothetical protein